MELRMQNRKRWVLEDSSEGHCSENHTSLAWKQPVFTHFQRRNELEQAMKKQQVRGNKSLFRLEIRFFSSSIALPVQKQFFAGD
jgi:hypothetical protein